MALLSIVVPTRNRIRTACNCIDTLLKIESSEIEIIVSDCSNDRSLGSWLDMHIDDERLNYEYIPSEISMTENWNLALKRVDGEYVTIIGDDDGVSSAIVELVRYAKSIGVDGITSEIAEYFWPDFPDRFKQGEFRVGEFVPDIKKVDIEEKLVECSHSEGTNINGLVGVYYSIVKKSLLDNLAALSGGSYFKCYAPDYYSAFALSSLAKNVIHFGFPVFIKGSSLSSNTGRAMTGDTHKHFKEYKEFKEWNEIVPISSFWKAGTLDSVLCALYTVNRIDLASNLSINATYIGCICYEPKRFKEIIRRYLEVRYKLRGSTAYLEAGFILSSVVTYFLKEALVAITFKRSWYKPKGKYSYEKGNVNDIAEATQLLDLIWHNTTSGTDLNCIGSMLTEKYIVRDNNF